MPDKVVQNMLWKFVKNYLDIATFEQWLYHHETLEIMLGKELYLELISVDYRDKNAVFSLGNRLEKWLEIHFPLLCECSLADFFILDQGSEYWGKFLQSLNSLAYYGPDRWWLSLQQCSVCKEYWLCASETRINDVDFLKKIERDIAEKVLGNREWPACFTTLESLLSLAAREGKSVRFVDWHSYSLMVSIEDLKKERPGISEEELAFLLQIDLQCVRDNWVRYRLKSFWNCLKKLFVRDKIYIQ
jgi:hypothetical protein